jgi:hypothetical protein
MVSVYIVLLHKVQLHVSALDNGHLQVAHDILIKQLYKTYGLYTWGGKEGTCARDPVCHRRWEVWILGGLLLYYV